MSESATSMVCSACGTEVSGRGEMPFRCPAARAGDDVDHVLARRLQARGVAFARTGDVHPFLRYRELLHAYQFARAHGLDDPGYEGIVRELDSAVAAIDGAGFRVTPFAREEALSAWVKDETGNVSGSHKGRHLFGVAIWLRALETLELLPRGEARLAIASCGNAALAAAVLARALEAPLEVFVPPGADPRVLARLETLGACVTRCPRAAEQRGDPCYARFLEALDRGALPFSVQGSQNGLAVEGGATLAYELIEELAARDVRLDRIFVQVGGGALASAVLQGFHDARALGVWRHPLPRLHAVQTVGAHPLKRAFDAVLARGGDWREVLADAAQHRSRFMRAWEEEPRSVADGILDDETYDWRAVVAGMLESGGTPVLVSEERLLEAHSRASASHLVSATGSAGFAGLLELRARGESEPPEEVAVLFTGVER